MVPWEGASAQFGSGLSEHCNNLRGGGPLQLPWGGASLFGGLGLSGFLQGQKPMTRTEQTWEKCMVLLHGPPPAPAAHGPQNPFSHPFWTPEGRAALWPMQRQLQGSGELPSQGANA